MGAENILKPSDYLHLRIKLSKTIPIPMKINQGEINKFCNYQNFKLQKQKKLTALYTRRGNQLALIVLVNHEMRVKQYRVKGCADFQLDLCKSTNSFGNINTAKPLHKIKKQFASRR